ncbi:MAG: bifunctional riboflavin kinase/FAD synthetase [Candidatus Eisenbacteria bacterium]|uniref:Riboflavin biosynthesis protein n=1 Tax=Eiseniibacteriota bacterium TaxID=2212470 RepID=A0A9D6L7F1_UNCEI|nr:bifunctional riboflavin kinase/FAD synthetase [Candidatus Eisenbacteria bacterium]MBI3538980.1 bifunctional riboflavin kinase/FAD synthetase [Candidatus Eisenbacteria bacterium]
MSGPVSHDGAHSIVAIGIFDGVHLGHRAILARALARAAAGAGDAGRAATTGGATARSRCVVVSFDPHPDVVLARGAFTSPLPLTPLDEKRALLMALGIDAFVVLPFTRELASLSPEAFVDEHLVRPFAPAALVVGEGFALGRGRTGTVERLAAIGEARGFAVEAVPLVQLDGAPVSSTRIRERLAAGGVAEAARLLGRRYRIAGRVVTGDGRGRTLGFPTANLMLDEERVVPADGVYAALAYLDGGREAHAAAMSIGLRPTFGGHTRTIEAHLLDWSGDLVGRPMTVEFAAWLRPELRFDGAEALIAAMKDDVAEARRRLAG